jgi:TrmH family RNA methyltransferase
MRTQRIYTKNAAYQKFEVLLTNRNKRHKYGEFLGEGVRNINGAVNNGWKITSFLCSGERRLSDWAAGMLQRVDTEVNYELSEQLMAELSGKENTSELMAVVKMRGKKSKKKKRFR